MTDPPEFSQVTCKCDSISNEQCKRTYRITSKVNELNVINTNINVLEPDPARSEELPIWRDLVVMLNLTPNQLTLV